MTHRRWHVLLLGALALCMLPAPVAAQRWSMEPEERGWIGVSFQIESDRWGRAGMVTITEVLSDSPASEAGVRPGDRLLAVNDLDSPEELNDLSSRLRLRPGDRVVMELERAGERRRIQLRAARRPDEVELGRRIEVTYSSPDQVEAWVRSMDSLRIHLVRERGAKTLEVRAELPPGADDDGRLGAGSERSRRGERTLVISSESGAAVRAPFEFFVFRGEDYDSLQKEMVELNRSMSELQRRVAQRTRELNRPARRSESGQAMELAEDDEIRGLQRRIEELTLRSMDLKDAMAREARESAGFEYLVRTPGAGSAAPSPTPPPEATEFRPLTPYLVGRNRVAGAEVVDLRPELARYFDVDGGVLVVDVAAGTPASMAGLIPGDVITRLDQVTVRSVDELRVGISRARGSLPITLVREGRSVQVLLSR